MNGRHVILAPLRGVTIRCFRQVFAEVIRAAGFTEAVTPFIAASAGVDPLKDRELRTGRETGAGCAANAPAPWRLTPQFIGKDPEALRFGLERIKSAGYETADLNCGCPFPMVRNKGRGSGLLRTPEVLRRMLEVGCEVMGPGRFSVKTRLGVSRTDELLRLMPMLNEFPLRFLTVHARTAEQMYEGRCDGGMLRRIEAAARMPVVRNGDIPLPGFVGPAAPSGEPAPPLMIGRAFLRHLGARDDIGMWLDRYVAASVAELCGTRPVVGRIKELLAYWKDLPRWRRRWQVAKLARTLDELRVWN
ncbi:MAG: tRNA-dihydrouridine synthase family protein [Kiritimatiellia bacterium]